MSIKTLHYIYFIFDLKSKHGYVGKSIHPSKRAYQHWQCRFKGEDYRDHWLRKFPCLPPLKILRKCSEKNWQKWERYFIAKLKSEGWALTNLTDGGEGLIGYKPTRETIEKNRSSHMGITHTLESRRKMSEGHKGKKLSEDHKRKISKSLTGKTHSKKTRRKMSVSQMGRKHTEEAIRKISISQRRRYRRNSTRS